jgi:hypothetical protein
VPGPRQSLDDYIRDRVGQFHSFGGSVLVGWGGVIDGLGWATLHGAITFGERNAGQLGVFEIVQLDEHGVPHRLKYGYQCLYDRDFLFRYDYDPIQHDDMPYHKHLPPNERRVLWDRVTLQEVVDEFWPMIVDRDEAAAAAAVETESDPGA